MLLMMLQGYHIAFVNGKNRSCCCVLFGSRDGCMYYFINLFLLLITFVHG